MIKVNNQELNLSNKIDITSSISKKLGRKLSELPNNKKTRLRNLMNQRSLSPKIINPLSQKSFPFSSQTPEPNQYIGDQLFLDHQLETKIDQLIQSKLDKYTKKVHYYSQIGLLKNEKQSDISQVDQSQTIKEQSPKIPPKLNLNQYDYNIHHLNENLKMINYQMTKNPKKNVNINISKPAILNDLDLNHEKNKIKSSSLFVQDQVNTSAYMYAKPKKEVKSIHMVAAKIDIGNVKQSSTQYNSKNKGEQISDSSTPLNTYISSTGSLISSKFDENIMFRSMVPNSESRNKQKNREINQDYHQINRDSRFLTNSLQTSQSVLASSHFDKKKLNRPQEGQRLETKRLTGSESAKLTKNNLKNKNLTTKTNKNNLAAQNCNANVSFNEINTINELLSKQNRIRSKERYQVFASQLRTTTDNITTQSICSNVNQRQYRASKDVLGQILKTKNTKNIQFINTNSNRQILSSNRRSAQSRSSKSPNNNSVSRCKKQSLIQAEYIKKSVFIDKQDRSQRNLSIGDMIAKKNRVVLNENLQNTYSGRNINSCQNKNKNESIIVQKDKLIRRKLSPGLMRSEMFIQTESPSKTTTSAFTNHFLTKNVMGRFIKPKTSPSRDD